MYKIKLTQLNLNSLYYKVKIIFLMKINIFNHNQVFEIDIQSIYFEKLSCSNFQKKKKKIIMRLER